MKRFIYIGIGLLVILVLSAGLYWFFPNLSFVPRPSAPWQGEALPRGEAPAGWREYKSEQYGFSLLYPEDLSVKEYDEGGRASTITFENVETLQGFQIFIVLFDGEQITEERFRQDIPSGVRKNLMDITVGGATGAAFYSEHDLLGETYEVWFIHGGYLFEVTTLKPLEQSLQSVMNTWHFL